MTIIGHHTCPVKLFVVVEFYATFASETNGLNYVTYNKKITIKNVYLTHGLCPLIGNVTTFDARLVSIGW
jgi:hypothetical protein